IWIAPTRASIFADSRSGDTRLVCLDFLPLFHTKGKESIPIYRQFGLVGQIRLGPVKYSCERWFRAKLAQWLRTIRVIWAECPRPNSIDIRYLNRRTCRRRSKGGPKWRGHFGRFIDNHTVPASALMIG